MISGPWCHVLHHHAIIFLHQWRAVSLTPTLSCIASTCEGRDRRAFFAAHFDVFKLLRCIDEDATHFFSAPPTIEHADRKTPDTQDYRFLCIAETLDKKLILVDMHQVYLALGASQELGLSSPMDFIVSMPQIYARIRTWTDRPRRSARQPCDRLATSLAFNPSPLCPQHPPPLVHRLLRFLQLPLNYRCKITASESHHVPLSRYLFPLQALAAILPSPDGIVVLVTGEVKRERQRKT